MKKIIIVTVNFNTEDDTKNLLHSLENVKISGFLLETIVVDNGSFKTFKVEYGAGKKNKLTVIRLDKNTGFSGGYNAGVNEAMKRGADYVLVINNDTIVDSSMLVHMFYLLESDSKIGVATPKIYFAKGHEFHKDRYKKDDLGKVLWFAGGYFDWDNIKSVHRGVDEVDHGQYDKSENIDFASGCCMMIKKEVIEKAGVFDDKFFLYYEDADFNIRVRNAGYDIFYVPKAILRHVNASSSGGAGNSLQDYFLTRNQMLFGMRYAPLKAKIALIRQSIRLLIVGRPEQKLAIKDFYLGRLGKGSFFK